MSRYAKAKRYALPGTLAELHGPTRGVVSLPAHLHWGPDNRYDLADNSDTAVMYERMIREAVTAQDLADHLDAGTLQRLWHHLIIPREVRDQWQARFPELHTGQDQAP